MKTIWKQNGNAYRPDEVSNEMPVLPKGVYKLAVDMFDELYLERTQDAFEFTHKVYGTETALIERTVKSWNNTTGNMGVLLNGMKGTGKTVTAKQIANSIGLPVIIIPFHHKKLVSFINDIQQDVIIFVDEFEKIYDGYQNSLLTIMDGVMNTKHRLFFLLTTNELRVDKNLLQRPGRVRYVKTFTDMSLETIMEVVNDKLLHPELKECTVEFISQLPIITMDLITSIIEEVNVHVEDPINFKDVFNIYSDRNDLFNVFKIEKGQEEMIANYITINNSGYFDSFSVGSEFRVGGRYKGSIVKVMGDHEIMVQSYDNDDNEIFTHYRVEKASKTHRAFANNPHAF